MGTNGARPLAEAGAVVRIARLKDSEGELHGWGVRLPPEVRGEPGLVLRKHVLKVDRLYEVRLVRLWASTKFGEIWVSMDLEPAWGAGKAAGGAGADTGKSAVSELVELTVRAAQLDEAAARRLIEEGRVDAELLEGVGKAMLMRAGRIREEEGDVAGR